MVFSIFRQLLWPFLRAVLLGVSPSFVVKLISVMFSTGLTNSQYGPYWAERNKDVAPVLHHAVNTEVIVEQDVQAVVMVVLSGYMQQGNIFIGV